MAEALAQWQSQLRPDRPSDVAAFEKGIALLGVGREVIRSREGTGTATAPNGFAVDEETELLERGCVSVSAGHHKGVLRNAA